MRRRGESNPPVLCATRASSRFSYVTRRGASRRPSFARLRDARGVAIFLRRATDARRRSLISWADNHYALDLLDGDFDYVVDYLEVIYQ